MRGSLPSILRFLPKKTWSRQGHYSRSEAIATKMSSLKILNHERTRRAINPIQENGEPYPRPQHELVRFTPARNKIMTTKPRLGVSCPFSGLLYSHNQCERTRDRAVFYSEKKYKGDDSFFIDDYI